MTTKEQVPTMALRPKTGYLPTLDGWRAIAIGMVFFTHFRHTSVWPRWLEEVRGLGQLGVDLFFAISGVLICSRLLEEEKSKGRISLRGFYIRRSFRIFPAAFVYLSVVALLAAARLIPMDWPAWLSAVLFVRNYFTCLVRDSWLNFTTGHFWSLGIEEHFYLVLPGLLVLFRRGRKSVLLALTVVAFVWLLCYLHWVPDASRSIYWQRRSDLRIGSLLLPAWLALFLGEKAGRDWLSKFARPWPMLAVAALVIIGATASRVRAEARAGIDPQSYSAGRSDQHSSAPRGGPAYKLSFAVPILFPFLILSTMLHPGSLLSRALEWEPLRAVGRVSYSLYLWQQLFWAASFASVPIPLLHHKFAGIFMTVSFSVISYFFLEKPLIRFGHRLANPVTPGHADLANATGS